MNQEKIYNIYLELSKCSLYVAYPRSAQAYGDASTSTCVNEKNERCLVYLFVKDLFESHFCERALKINIIVARAYTGGSSHESHVSTWLAIFALAAGVLFLLDYP